ncbi:MAG: class I SAM-dependent methyltransferase [Salinivirgaceae bacterium]|nr:class I SAM-dependent methyltransferase [Salinivirgaceae bacterium]
MKTKNPKSRFDLNIKRSDKVLEVGGGHNPHYRSNIVVDKFIDSNYHRHSDIKVLKNQQFMQADGENLPFKENDFEYVICNQVLEHVEDPAKFLNEQMRVSKRGYIEVPSLIGEYLFPKKSHKWLILELDNKLVLVDKEKFWFKTKLDLGFLFLTYLPKTSIAYKILMDTKPNFMTIRYEWKDSIDYVINPDNPEYLKYFNGYWNEEMVQQFFPHKGNFSELVSFTKSFLKILFQQLCGKYLLEPVKKFIP